MQNTLLYNTGAYVLNTRVYTAVNGHIEYHITAH